jgi:hypothetical protein
MPLIFATEYVDVLVPQDTFGPDIGPNTGTLVTAIHVVAECVPQAVFKPFTQTFPAQVPVVLKVI